MKTCFAPTFMSALLFVSQTLHAASPAPQLTVNVTIRGHGQNQSAHGDGQWQTSESFSASVSMIPGQPADTNPMDVAGNGAQLQQQFADARASSPSPEQQKDVMLRAQAAIANCKGDVSCMSRIAQQLGNTTAAWAVRPANRNGDQGRFLTFVSPPLAECKADYQVKIQRRGEGHTADVQGMVPFTTNTTVDYRASPQEHQTFCSQLGQIVLDTRTNTIFVPRLPMAPQGRYTRTEGTHTTIDSQNATANLQEDAMAWVQKKLYGAALNGKERVVLNPAYQGEGSGQNTVEVEMRWSFNYK